jgi:hypothetical protein
VRFSSWLPIGTGRTQSFRLLLRSGDWLACESLKLISCFKVWPQTIWSTRSLASFNPQPRPSRNCLRASSFLPALSNGRRRPSSSSISATDFMVASGLDTVLLFCAGLFMGGLSAPESGRHRNHPGHRAN